MPSPERWTPEEEVPIEDDRPYRPFDQVIEGLWQADSSCEPVELFASEFDVVIDLSGRAVSGLLPLGVVYVAHPIHDVERIDDPDAIRALARFAAGEVRRGRRVAVNCAAGLNRSGVVVGRALLELGYAADEAIALIRRARGSWALSNREFERWLRHEMRVPTEVA